jgi:hypothetical protein
MKDLVELGHILSLDVDADNESLERAALHGVFPDSDLPFTVNEDFLRRLNQHELQGTLWKAPIDKQETAYSTFLNDICKAIHHITQVPIRRAWTAQYRNTPLTGSPIPCKPDLALIDSSQSGAVTWRSVRCLAVVTSGEYATRPDPIATPTDKAYIILNTQHNCVFVPTLDIWGDVKFCLAIADRQGQLRSINYNLASGRRICDTLAFLRIIVGLRQAKHRL